LKKYIKIKTIDKSTNIEHIYWDTTSDKDFIKKWEDKQQDNENLYIEIGDSIVLLSLKEQRELENLSKDWDDIASDIVEDYKQHPSEWPSGSGMFINQNYKI